MFFIHSFFIRYGGKIRKTGERDTHRMRTFIFTSFFFIIKHSALFASRVLRQKGAKSSVFLGIIFIHSFIHSFTSPRLVDSIDTQRKRPLTIEAAAVATTTTITVFI
jgi:asparagine N-glycosylation enzyme membrane subunit Stt3